MVLDLPDFKSRITGALISAISRDNCAYLYHNPTSQVPPEILLVGKSPKTYAV